MANIKINISVSVVVPCFCCSTTLKRAVESILAQTVLPSELILVNDGSDDKGKTIDLIQEISTKIPDNFFPVKVINLKKNMGPAFARNAGWDVAVHDYVAFLDADDAWDPKKLQAQYECMKSNALLDFTCHNSIFIHSGNLGKRVTALNADLKLISLESMLIKNRVATRSVMIKRSCNHRFNPSMRYAEDYDLWMRIIGSSGKGAYLGMSLAYVYKPEWSSGGLSGNLWAMQVGECKSLLNVYKQKRISMLVLIAVEIFSFIKFLRRIIIFRIIK